MPSHYLNQYWFIEHLWTNFNEIWDIQTFSFKKINKEMSSAKWRLFCVRPQYVAQLEFTELGNTLDAIFMSWILYVFYKWLCNLKNRKDKIPIFSHTTCPIPISLVALGYFPFRWHVPCDDRYIYVMVSYVFVGLDHVCGPVTCWQHDLGWGACNLLPSKPWWWKNTRDIWALLDFCEEATPTRRLLRTKYKLCRHFISIVLRINII